MMLLYLAIFLKIKSNKELLFNKKEILKQFLKFWDKQQIFVNYNWIR